MIRGISFSLLAFFAVGSLWADGQAPYCVETKTTIAIDEVSALGFSGQDLIDLTMGERYSEWAWSYKNNTTGLSVRVDTMAQEAVYVESVAVYPEGSPDIGIICASRVEVPVWLTYATDDGAFNERWFTTIYDTDGTDCMTEIGDECLTPGLEARIHKNFTLEQLNGTFFSDVMYAPETELNFTAETVFSHNGMMSNVFGTAFTCTVEACHTYLILGGETLPLEDAEPIEETDPILTP